MCLAIPMKLLSRDGFIGTVEVDGVRRQISLLLQDDARIGEYLLVHAGYAIGKVDEQEALETIELIRSASQQGDNL
jgi:hydrogenase expression/formation protein HypC